MHGFLGSLIGRKLVFMVIGYVIDVLNAKYGWGMGSNDGLWAGGGLAGMTAFEDFAKHLAKKEAVKERAALKK